MKDKIDKCSLKLTINKEDIYNKPKIAMLSMVYFQIH